MYRLLFFPIVFFVPMVVFAHERLIDKLDYYPELFVTILIGFCLNLILKVKHNEVTEIKRVFRVFSVSIFFAFVTFLFLFFAEVFEINDPLIELLFEISSGVGIVILTYGIVQSNNIVISYQNKKQELEKVNKELDSTKKDLVTKNKELQETLDDFYTLRITMEKQISEGTFEEENKKIKKRLDELNREI